LAHPCAPTNGPQNSPEPKSAKGQGHKTQPTQLSPIWDIEEVKLFSRGEIWFRPFRGGWTVCLSRIMPNSLSCAGNTVLVMGPYFRREPNSTGCFSPQMSTLHLNVYFALIHTLLLLHFAQQRTFLSTQPKIDWYRLSGRITPPFNLDDSWASWIDDRLGPPGVTPQEEDRNWRVRRCSWGLRPDRNSVRNLPRFLTVMVRDARGSKLMRRCCFAEGTRNNFRVEDIDISNPWLFDNHPTHTKTWYFIQTQGTQKERYKPLNIHNPEINPCLRI